MSGDEPEPSTSDPSTSADGADRLAVTRRGALTRFGASGVACMAGLLALPGPFTSPSGESASSEGVGDAEPVSEEEYPYAIWQYRRNGDEFESTAPINVVFPLDSASFEDVVSTFRDAGWYPHPESYVRYAWDRAEEEYLPETWEGAETYFGKVGRLHVRCWELDGTGSVQAHIDSAATPKHTITSYVEGRLAVERLFEEAGWAVDDERLDLGNDSDPDHDGLASVIRR